MEPARHRSSKQSRHTPLLFSVRYHPGFLERAQNKTHDRNFTHPPNPQTRTRHRHRLHNPRPGLQPLLQRRRHRHPRRLPLRLPRPRHPHRCRSSLTARSRQVEAACAERFCRYGGSERVGGRQDDRSAELEGHRSGVGGGVGAGGCGRGKCGEFVLMLDFGSLSEL